MSQQKRIEMLEKKEKVQYIIYEFKQLFKEKSDCELYSLTKDELFLYRLCVGTIKEERHLKCFAKVYFQFRNFIINTRNDLVSFEQSEEYKKEKFLNKIRLKKELRKYQKLCDNVCGFEELFFELMGFSIAKVENERFREELKLKKQSEVIYLN